MLLNFTVKNWLSFKDEVVFSMEATREKQHQDRIPYIESLNTKVLPVSALYGGNASGKTNFFKAINFMRQFIIDGPNKSDEIIRHPFLLDNNSQNEPSVFSATIIVNEESFEYGFSINNHEVLEEWLKQNLQNSQKDIFHRKYETTENNIVSKQKIHWGSAKYAKDKFLNFTFKGTKKNKLFITNAESQNVTNFQSIYNWFKNTLTLVSPDQRFYGLDEFFKEGTNDTNYISKNLALLDTGIQRLGQESIALDLLPIPSDLKESLEKSVGEKVSARIEGSNGDFFTVKRKKGKLVASRIIAYHSNTEGKDVKFNLNQESDGTRRVIELLPAYQDLKENPAVYIIDELERSLHTLLTRTLLNNYLSSCTSSSRSQLLFTTHDLLLMDQDIFRRDEMWVADRNSQGSSKLIGFSEYKDIRSDKDIRRSYLMGRMGGIPNIVVGT